MSETSPISKFFGVITIRNEVAKVMFLQTSVCPQGGYLTRYPPDQVHPLEPGTSPWDQVHAPGPGTPPGTRYTPQDQVHPLGPGIAPSLPRYGHCCARYASYWNAFLLNDQYMLYNVQRIIDYNFLVENLSFRLQI